MDKMLFNFVFFTKCVSWYFRKADTVFECISHLKNNISYLLQFFLPTSVIFQNNQIIVQ